MRVALEPRVLLPGLHAPQHLHLALARHARPGDFKQDAPREMVSRQQTRRRVVLKRSVDPQRERGPGREPDLQEPRRVLGERHFLAARQADASAALRDRLRDGRGSVERERDGVLRAREAHRAIEQREELLEERLLGLGVMRGDVEDVVDVDVDVVVRPQLCALWIHGSAAASARGPSSASTSSSSAASAVALAAQASVGLEALRVRLLHPLSEPAADAAHRRERPASASSRFVVVGRPSRDHRAPTMIHQMNNRRR
mmetsp:Transcript_1558/g.5166  ORF Transcript_1558/g.5166 Transcript_1558/m.5166 type:complete len:257 (-) Transcript_1558:169-939(-)